MDIAHPLPSTVASLSFSFLSTDDVRRISVKQLTNPILLDDLNRPTIGGLYDPALGPSGKNDICATCRLTYFTCPGHYGHIELPSPVYHPLFMIPCYTLLRTCCLYCHKFKVSRITVARCAAKLRLLEHGLLKASLAVDDFCPLVKKGDAGSPSKPQSLANADSDASDSEAEDAVQESQVELINRLNVFVMLTLKEAAKGREDERLQRDRYKDNLVFQARKAVIAQWWKEATVKKCSSCGAFANTFRKEGHTKIIMYALTKKQQDIHDQTGRTIEDVHITQPKLESERARAAANSQGTGDVEMRDADGSESEESSGPETPDDDDDPMEAVEEQLPKAANGTLKTSRGRSERVLSASEVRAHLRLLFQKEVTLTSLLYGRHGPYALVHSHTGLVQANADIFFLSVLPVPPTRFRPPAKMGEQLFEHPQNELLARVLATSYRIRDVNVQLAEITRKGSAAGPEETDKLLAVLFERLVQLQVDVNSFMDSGKNPQPVRQGKKPPEGVKQRLEKKEGLFRMNMMGKRVNYAARSVISPDVNIETSEIGIPPVFARKLTFAEPVTAQNLTELQQLVENGPRKYPGATMVEYEDGSRQSLDKLSDSQRAAVAATLQTAMPGRGGEGQGMIRSGWVNKKVYRHLRDGDYLLLNRQPTLHKPSIMAHRAKVLKGEKTIRLHYANCESYNADFDGDEMNIHFAQNHIARAEAMSIANTDNQYLVPKTGEPLRGLIQDHVVSAFFMTAQDTFFTREEYQQIIYGALRPENNYTGGGIVLTVPPTIWKPRPLWTGKQIISTILKNITPARAEGLNLQAKAKIGGNMWRKDSEEGVVLVMDGELITGVIDKAQIGASAHGITHSVYELYGPETAGKLISIWGRLFTKFLQHRAFTCRMDDLLLSPEGEEKRKKLMESGQSLGLKAAVSNFPDLAQLETREAAEQVKDRISSILRDEVKMAGLDMTYRGELNQLTVEIEKACLPGGLVRPFPVNHMQAMIMAGAKGKPVNARQISSSLGQQDLEGRRPPVMISGKTLPSFQPFETSAEAGGYVGSRFLTGLRPQEFYFHCMAGREGLIDTAVKTSRSGYLQRCLIKHLEGARVHYDHTVRSSDNSVLQFQYGGDALDVIKQAQLTQFDFAVQNLESYVNNFNPKDVWNKLDVETALSHMKKALKKPGKHTPVLAKYSPSRFLGATSEAFAREVETYIEKNPRGLIKKKKAEGKSGMPAAAFRSLMNVRYMRSLVEPGEAVGLLAAQCIGEPSTQMTLNTFHFAGHGAANVTLGIPRLREIVMTASTKPKTPTMTIVMKASDSPTEQVAAKAQKLCQAISRVTLADLVHKITVKERIETANVPGSLSRHKSYTVTLDFFSKEEYKEEHNVSPRQVLAALGTNFALVLKREIAAELKKINADFKGQASGIGKGKAPVDDDAPAGGDQDEDDAEPRPAARNINEDAMSDGDGDNDDEKRAVQMRQQATYDDERSDQSDDEGMFDDAAIDAEIADDDEDDENTLSRANPDEIAQEVLLDAQTEEMRDLFLETVPQATRFNFKKGIWCELDLQFPLSAPKLLLVGLIERCCANSVVREIPGLQNCFVVAADATKRNIQTIAGEAETKVDLSQIQLMTNGCNFPALWQILDDSVDPDLIYSNDINAVLQHYGVEAARFAIVQEIRAVFSTYGIEVNFRHLRLIADYMTFDGGYKPFNRSGIATSSSPLLKASYETTASFLSDATLYGDFDDLSSPSGTIVIGKPSNIGTGGFDIVAPVA
ncbi:subunit of DNA dependent RNA-polymerase [Dacryopinax primogenitus]|uniref:DNA-directed RNA polymerase subunit n=1 Tax=Dacryopinax primogenitus (strain DJM 731) TaxID=1858805 RepID=M5G9S3_DACPD|nr:subunit of DNA dependent RNA-polymerase [Dacryopinax primogenitus]EJU02622.1 subunit of DNA dependent RNA-polymerase [Dacryopinax primogenitus]